MNIKNDLAGVFSGDVDDTDASLDFYSHDASLFELRPEIIVFPKDSKDIQSVVKYVAQHKSENPNLSVTARSQGTDMSGGAINDSIILDSSRYMTKFWDVSADSAWTQPGVKYKDFEVETLKHGSYMPSYPASRDLAGMGGIVNNNSGGEKSLKYGKTAKYVSELKMVLADGNEYTIKPLKKDELVRKMSQGDFEGNLYKQTFELIEANYGKIKAAKPRVSKDSTGYHIWDVWDRETGIFDLTKLFVGAQGTLGLMSEAKLDLVRKIPESGLLILFLRDINKLGDLIPEVLKSDPETFESFDDQTLWLTIKFLPSFYKMLGFKGFVKLLFSLIPDGLQLLRGIPKLILMVEFTGETDQEVIDKVKALHTRLGKERAKYEINGIESNDNEQKSERYQNP